MTSYELQNFPIYSHDPAREELEIEYWGAIDAEHERWAAEAASMANEAEWDRLRDEETDMPGNDEAYDKDIPF
jgi:hypothetical protein